MKAKVLEVVTNYYLKSGNFSGISLESLSQEIFSNEYNLINILSELIEQNEIGLISQKHSINPHINRLGFSLCQDQLECLHKKDVHHTCFYPTKKHLKNVVKEINYVGQPFQLMLALGNPQLTIENFDLSIIELYRNDPRYYYVANDIGGSLGTEDEFYESDKFKITDQVHIQSFGFSYNDERRRALCAFICDLADLSSEHQLIWKAKHLKENYEPHPAFYNSQVRNIWPKGVNILTAVIQEIYTINRITKMIWSLPLFKDDFGEYGERRPRKFSFLIRPTLEEYNYFISLFDKVISDNLNHKFFKGKVIKEYDERRKSDDKIIVKYKGSILMLDEWIRSLMRFPDDTGWINSISAFKEVRKQRQNPAHKIEEDIYDQRYFKLQEEIIDKVWAGLNYLRIILQQHPNCNEEKLDIPEWQRENYIYSM